MRVIRLLQPERNFAHEAGVVAVGQPLGLRRNSAQQVGERLHLRLRVIAEDMGGDELLPARAGVADADANAAEVGAKRGVDRAQAVVPGEPAADAHLHLEGREVELVMEDGESVDRRACRSEAPAEPRRRCRS